MSPILLYFDLGWNCNREAKWLTQGRAGKVGQIQDMNPHFLLPRWGLLFSHYPLEDGCCLVVFTELLIERQDALVPSSTRKNFYWVKLGRVSRLAYKVHKNRRWYLTFTSIQREGGREGEGKWGERERQRKSERERMWSVIYRLTFSSGPHNTCLLEIICLSVHKVEGHARKVFISCVLNGSIVIWIL